MGQACRSWAPDHRGLRLRRRAWDDRSVCAGRSSGETGNTADKADRSPKPDRRCCEPRWSARRITPQTRPQLAKIYYNQLVDRSAEHRMALCVVAGYLARLGGRAIRREPPPTGVVI
jgi:hypothetical protein